MLHSERFDPYIIVSPDMQRSLEHKINTYRKSYADLTAMYGDRVLHGFDEEQQSYLELGENYPVVSLIILMRRWRIRITMNDILGTRMC